MPVELKLTLSPLNYDQIVNVYALALRLGCQYSFKPVENLVHYTNSRQAAPPSFSGSVVRGAEPVLSVGNGHVSKKKIPGSPVL